MEKVNENKIDEDENMEPKASSSSAEKILKETEKLSKTISMTSKKLRSSSRLTKESEEVTKSKELEMEEEEVEISSPGEPCEVSATSSSITLAWEPPKQGYENIEYYEVKYRENGRKRKRWTSCFTDDRKETFTINDLIGDTKYEFKVRAIMEGEVEGPFSETSNAMKTRFSLAKQIASQYETIKISHGPPIVYKVPVREILGARNRATMTRKCIFGQPDPSAMEKTIMMVGATGAGKSTLIDGMINYITDVSWEDDFRFSIIDLMEDELKKKGNEANSQTEWITSYTVNHKSGSPVDYTLNIIDTPGFGDTRGLQRDKKIVDQIRGFFETPGENGVTGIDAVCFVTQAPLARLTPPQKYIFDAILSVFGADIASNIFVLITFADGHDPPVRAALEEAKVPFAKSFKFNNSALFSSTADAEEVVFGKMFWSMGKESFKKFFDELGRVEQRSLWMTNKVLQLRQRLEATIQGLQPQIEEGLNQLNTIRQEQEVLRRHKAEIEANKNFTYEVEEIHAYQEPTDPGTFITNCLKCNRTCHYPCRIPDDDGKKRCLSIDPNVLTCMVCPQRCHWSLHKNNDFRYVTYTMKIQKTYEQLKEKYNVAQDQERKTRDVLMKVKESFREMGKQVTKNVSDVRRCINQLNEIALRPNPLTDLDYINILIENEKNEKKYGWESRVELYQKARKEAELVKKAGEQDFSPWEDVDDVLQDE
ncbi:hypothetical protein FSP39_006380 [Pinctada imbricata]|uniref:Fibronectin type-III domain-containing protein n=1 Tax=Pinctada imbricata TaxID=66713 RepID=A0AA88YDU5_PINIB|nr:hypothetical protein FSP39_006380 [Pinctada imbricata]